VTVAVHRRAIETVPAPHTPQQFAEAVIREYHAAWHVFGGFPLDAYVFKIRAPDDKRGLVLSQGGVALDAEDYDHLDQAHEIFHAWNGQTFTYVPDGAGTLFQLETWIQEGATIYYAARADNSGVGFQYFPEQRRGEWYHDAQLNGLFDGYVRRVGGPFDRPYAELISRAGTRATEEGTMAVGRSVGLVYLIDRELRPRGSNLDELMRHLYVDFGLAGRRYNQADVDAFLRARMSPDGFARFQSRLRTATPLAPDLVGGFGFLYR
jgi:predicted metalloprotease with PDZ domain